MFVKEVKSCDDCPCVEIKRRYTPDSFETVYDWLCKSSAGSIIATVDWSDQKPEIPSWCPLRKEGN